MTKLLVLLFLLFSIAFTKEYPLIYSQLGNPLYESVSSLSKLSNIGDLNQSCSAYIAEANTTLEYGKKVDKTDKKAVKEYLKKLRKLQKEYDKSLRKINGTINSAIDKKEYEKFLKLTDCDLEGLLKSRTLLKKSIAYYKRNREDKKSDYFEEKIDYSKLVQYYEAESFNKSVTQKLDSSKKSHNGKKKVYLEGINSNAYVLIKIHNQNPYAITLSIKGSYKNLKYDRNVAKIKVIKAKSTIEYIKLYRNEQKASYSISYSWIIGSKDAIHDDSYLYRLPYARGSSVVVSQGFNGRFTHKGSSKYAVDFAMPIGTKIYAAREGVVVRVKDNSNVGGRGKKYASSGNYITIVHSDDTFATYYHLKQNGVAVKIGQTVKKGEHIGYSGNTGNSSGPHLHFAVFKAKSSWATQSLPIRFLSAKGIVDNPKPGVYYKAK